MKVKSNQKGITLVALVVTIIVLLILAGIAISLTIGNNGLFSRARNAADTWNEASKKEENEMDDFIKLYDNTIKDIGEGGGEIEEPDTSVELSTVARPGDYIKYVVPANKSFTMTTDKTGYSTNQDFNTNTYADGEWQVLYNDDTNGLQIISRDDITAGTRLYLGTDNVEASAKLGYNNCVEALNEMCQQYVNSAYATRGRSVGSSPTNQPDTTQYYTNPSYSYITQYISGLKVADTNYTYDYNAMKEAKSQDADGIHKTTSIWYWLASRQVDETLISSQIHFSIWNIDISSGNPSGSQAYSRGAGEGQYIYRGQGHAVRAVITLNDHIKIEEGGDGTKEKPYVLKAMK